jgi:hypothetical protein
VKRGEGGQPKLIQTLKVSQRMLLRRPVPPPKLKMPRLEEQNEKPDVRLDTSRNKMLGMLDLRKLRRNVPSEGRLVRHVKSEHERRQKKNAKRRREFVELHERSKERGKPKKSERQRQERLNAAKGDARESLRVWKMTSDVARNPIDPDPIPLTKQKRDTPRMSMLQITIDTAPIGLVTKVSSPAAGGPRLRHQQRTVMQAVTVAHLDATLTCHIRS